MSPRTAERAGQPRRLPRQRADAGYAEACVLGDIDLVTPLGWAGVTCVLAAESDEPARYSRYVRAVIPVPDPWQHPARWVDRLVTWAGGQPVPPVLYCQHDGALLVASRFREQLAEAFRLLLPAPDLVEDTVDKARFAALAERTGLGSPRARVLGEAAGPAEVDELTFPLVLKPLTRQGYPPLQGAGMRGKAIYAGSPAELRALWPGLRAAGVDVLAQEMVAGPESAIESYHAYVGGEGQLAAEFTGVKLRTYPPQFGHSTAVRLTDSADVRDAGRDVLRRLGVRGVVKLDYKRDAAGRLWLLEVNPRFTLWHHLAGAAGLNIPALVHADLTGGTRPVTGPVRSGAAWCDLLEDRRAAAAAGVSTAAWLRFVLRCDARSGADRDDPLPFLRGTLAPRLAARAARPLRRLRGNPHPRAGD